ncbi:HAMP domain-containing sensor histidine kinase [Botrimarina sp.]|uniref:sensor histidine kinase n=1 Tax=Botrimarina sp. TaxID=2795802 RepID=UPI0032EF8B7D
MKRPVPNPTPDQPEPTPGLSLYRGEETADAAPAPDAPPASDAPPELVDLLDAWRSATSRLERTHAQLRDEVARLTAELEVKNRELARKNRLADLGEMASHVAHEVRNSLTPITLYLSLVRRGLAPGSTALSALSKAEAGFTALEATVNDLLAFSAKRQPQASGFLLAPMIEEVVQSLAPQLEAQGVDTEIDVPPGTPLWADREMLRRAVLNLLLNAMDAMPGGGEIVVTGCELDGWYELEVADNGPGFDDTQRSRLFEPFFSTKESGTGLGLSVVAHMAEAHGGSVLADNCPEGGAAFTIRLPKPIAHEAAA